MILAHPSNNFTAQEVADILGVGLSTRFCYLSQFRTLDNLSSACEQIKDSVGNYAYLTIEQEIEFLNTFKEEALRGHIVTVALIHDSLNKLLGHIVDRSTVYRMLYRHGWRLVKSDTKHSKSDPKAQEDFKNNLPILIGRALGLNIYNLPILVIFQNEARFGRMSTPVACWAPAPYRPMVDRALVRVFKYIYGGIAPKTDRLDYIISDKIDTENINKFLWQVSRSRHNNFIIMILDGVASHKSKSLNIPKNMVLIHLPPYSPELNPVERLWHILRRNIFANRYFNDLDSVIATATQGLAELQRNRAAVKSLTLCPWISLILNAI